MIEELTRRAILTKVPLLWLATAAAAALDTAFNVGAASTRPVPPPNQDTSIEAYVRAIMAEADPPLPMSPTGPQREHHALMALVPRSEATHVAVKDGSWFNTTTWWKSTVPNGNAKVLIPKDRAVTYDAVSDARQAWIRADGKLTFASDKASRLVVDTLVVGGSGTLEAGTEAQPVHPNVTVEVIITNNGPIDVTRDPLLLGRGLLAHGHWRFFGAPRRTFAKVAAVPMRRATQIQLQGTLDGWCVGDKAVITGTHQIPDHWDGTKLIDQGTQDEPFIVKAIVGNLITLDRPLKYNHDAPRADLKAYVANYTRNIVIRSENPAMPVSQRGHTMDMHSHGETVLSHVEFRDLGRTDKSRRAVDVLTQTSVASDTNVKGRYPVHLHQRGVNAHSQTVPILGCTIWGSPGWGIAQHSSKAIIEDCATYATAGAGFVAEIGDELGVWRRNIAIYAAGLKYDPEHAVKDGPDTHAFDLGRTGDGFWFQGRMVDAEDNVAAGCANSFVYMHRGGPGIADAANTSTPERYHYLPNLGINIPPIEHFRRNESICAKLALLVVKANPIQHHDLRSVIDGFLAWECSYGIHIEYTAHYTLKNIDIIGTNFGYKGERSHTLLSLGVGYDFVANKVSLRKGLIGLNLSRGNSGDIQTKPGEFNYVLIDVEGSDVDQLIKGLEPEDKVMRGSDLVDREPSLRLSNPGKVWSMADRTFRFDGTKTDSIGSLPLVNGYDTSQWGWLGIGQAEMSSLLSRQGYQTTADGRKVVLVALDIEDRATGRRRHYRVPVFLANDVPTTKGRWFLEAGDAKNLGPIDLSQVPDLYR